MTNPANTTSEDLKRIPGLFRRWELPEIFEANRDYHIEDAGAHADGTPLVALYSSEAPDNPCISAEKGKREDADPRDAIPANLLPEDIVAALPLALDIGALHDDRPLPAHPFLPLGQEPLGRIAVRVSRSIRGDHFMKHTPTPAVQPDNPINEIEFCAWVAQALPGERLEYHCGFLVLDTFPLFSRLDDKSREALRKLASRVFWAAEQGFVHLVQERIGTDQFAYIAVARPKPRSASISLSALLLEEEAA